MTQTTITQYYADDHDRLDGLFQQFQEYKLSDQAKARHFFEQFRSGLDRHIRWEEEILFPLFEDKNNMHGVGPTAVMRAEHIQIRDLLKIIGQRLSEGSSKTDQEEAFLQGHLGIHNMKEEKILYPAIDRLIRPSDLPEILRKMDEMPAD